jgi:Tol biopolymer transport system component
MNTFVVRRLVWTLTLAVACGSALGADIDGDGLPDDLDNCPTLYNPNQNLAPIKLNGPMAPLAEGIFPDNPANYYFITPDGAWALYRSDEEVAGVKEWYSVPAAGGESPLKLSHFLPSPGVIAPGLFDISRDSTRVVCTADTNGNGNQEIYSLRIGQSETATKLDEIPGGTGPLFSISPDSARVLYRYTVNKPKALYSVPIDGSASPVQISLPLPADGYLGGSPKVSPDSTRVVYLARQHNATAVELYSVPIDASESAVKLSPTLPAGAGLTPTAIQLAISPDSTRVVYTLDQGTASVFHLYTVPIGGGASVKISGNLSSSTDVDAFALSPDGSTVVFRTESSSSDALYSVPIAGDTSPIKLTPTMPSFADVNSFTISPDGSQVVFKVDRTVDDTVELYSVPIVGGAVVKLNGALVAGGEVDPYSWPQVSPDSTRAIYVADQDVDEIWEIYSAPVTGGPSIKLNGPMQPAGDISPVFELSGTSVLYHGDQELDQRWELYEVPVTGGESPHKLNGPLVPGGVVMDDKVNTGTSRVFYVADQDTDGVFELYSTPLVQDADGDAMLDPCDCVPMDSGAWSVPGEVTSLLFAQPPGPAGTTIIDWSAPSGGLSDRMRYDVIRSRAPGEFVAGAECIETDGGPSTGTTEPASPDPRTAFFYRVRAENVCGSGIAGHDSNGAPQPARDCP